MHPTIKKIAVNSLLITLTIAAAIAVGSQLPNLYQKWHGPARSGDFSAHVSNLPHRITLYGTTTCPYCETARVHLRNAGVPFNDQLVDKSPEVSAMFEKLNENSVPVLVTGSGMIVGFHVKAYDEFLRSHAP